MPVGAETAHIPFAGMTTKAAAETSLSPHRTDAPSPPRELGPKQAAMKVPVPPLGSVPQQAALQPAPAVEMSKPPTSKDIFSLYQLCGGSEERVIELLAHLWGTTIESITPTVRGWLRGLPDLKM